MLTAAAYDIHIEQLLAKMRRFHETLSAAGIPYRIVGGMAVFIHVAEREPIKARLTRDLDAAISRENLPRIIEAAAQGGFRYKHVRGIDMLLDPGKPDVHSAVHLLFLNEKVRPGDLEEVPGSEPDRTKEGILIAPVKDMVTMKLTSFRLKDKVHVQDMDSVGLITTEIEKNLSPALLERLAEVRATE